MTNISVDEIQRNPQAVLQRVEGGEAFLVLRDGQAVAEIKPLVSQRGQPRPFGLCAGELLVPDDFDAPLPEKVLQEFEGT